MERQDSLGSVLIFLGIYLFVLPLISIALVLVGFLIASINWTPQLLISISVVCYIGIASLLIIIGSVLNRNGE